MTLLIFAIVAGLAPGPVPTEGQAVDTTAAAIVADCNARKFETRVELEQDGQKRLTKLKLCAAKDGDDAAWLRTLEDAKTKIAGHPEISEDSKAKIAAELDAEIAKIKAVDPAAISLPAAPPPAASTVAANPTTAPAPAPAQAKPRLTIRCLEPGETGGGSPCISLERTTQLTIRADGDLPRATSLRFLRRGDMRGEIVLAAMRQGQLVRSKLPQQLCTGVSSSKVEIQILGSNQLVETLGPYLLRC